MLALLSMLSSTIAKLNKDEIKKHKSVLLEIFLSYLDYRTQKTQVDLIAIMYTMHS